jgi:hypothetical protein
MSSGRSPGRMVDLVGFEPTTSSMPWKRAPNCATGPLYARKNTSKDGVPKFIVPQLVGIVKPTVGRFEK